MENKHQRSKYNVIGLMSGTSLDGLDLAYCGFEYDQDVWEYHIMEAATVSYPPEWMEKLSNLHRASAYQFSLIHQQLGAWMGCEVKKICTEKNIKPDFVSSHGHTVFHEPHNGLTVQIGSGAAIAAASGLPTVCDFRALDVALGGQGAPLVPYGDKVLFAQYDLCLNLGGISNITYSFHHADLMAFDVCPANITLNKLANLLGYEFDKDGLIAQNGKIAVDLLARLNAMEYYRQKAPKSLGREWHEQCFWPHFLETHCSIEDKLATATEHIAMQIAQCMPQSHVPKKLLVTGGGAFNKYLISRLKHHLPENILVTIPHEKIIKYKEALIFAWLGLQRWNHQTNVLCTVTGAAHNHSGGCIYLI